MRIEVTEEDIRLGRRGSSMFCPVARAVSREVGMQVTVTYDSISAWEHGECIKTWDTPPEVRLFITRVDTCNIVSPAGFEL